MSATPTLDVHVENLTEEAVIPLGGCCAFPADVRPIFIFDELDEEQLTGLRSRGAQLAEILGYPPAPAVAHPEASWVYADPAFHLFGQNLVAADLEPAKFICRGSVGLVLARGEEGERTWTMAQHVRDTDREVWL